MPALTVLLQQCQANSMQSGTLLPCGLWPEERYDVALIILFILHLFYFVQDGTVVSPKSCPSSQTSLPTIDGECVIDYRMI